MTLMIALSNAGGLSGAGTNIPFLLIFFNFKMNEAVPLSICIGSISGLNRYIINFNNRHPNRPDRTCINYEIVILALPCVCMGAFSGVIIGKLIEEHIKFTLYCIIYSWSLYTTCKKARNEMKKEKLASKDNYTTAINDSP